MCIATDTRTAGRVHVLEKPIHTAGRMYSISLWNIIHCLCARSSSLFYMHAAVAVLKSWLE